jgi:hypothetical protein
VNQRPLRVAIGASLLSIAAVVGCDPNTDTSSSGGGGGATGSGGAVCEPWAEEACYDGPKDTEGVGICKAGTRTCKPDGSAWSPCADDTRPRTEKCDTPEDEDCNGVAESEFEGCCVPGTIIGCYSGPPGTQWVGLCKAGTKVCNELGTTYGACDGEVLPGIESCETPIDDDCDGKINEDVENCCEPGEVQDCYSGPPGTADVGICAGGTRYCNDDGTGFGPCEGEVTPEAELCDTLGEDESCDGDPACNGDHVWSKRYGDKYQTGLSGAVDLSGNVAFIGTFEETTDFGGGLLTSAGGSDVYIAKLDTAGAHVFSKRFGNASSQQGGAVAFDKDGNIFITGSFQGSIDLGGGPLTSAGGDDIFVAMLDPKGKHIWSRRFGGVGAQYGSFIGVDSFGYVYVAGTFSGSLAFDFTTLTSAGGDDIYVANLDPAGDVLWSKRAGDLGTDRLNQMAVDTSGNVYLTGSFPTYIDFGGGLLTSAGADDAFAAELDYNGGHLWSRSYGDLVSQAGTSIVVSELGDVYLTGDYQGTINLSGSPHTSAGGTDIFIAQLDASGSALWSKSVGGASDDHALHIAVDVAGNVLLTGQFQGTVNFGDGPLVSAGGNDVFVTKLDAYGEALWSQRFGDVAFGQVGRAVAADPDGNVLVVGTFGGTADFGGGPLVAKGTANAFVVKLEP